MGFIFFQQGLCLFFNQIQSLILQFFLCLFFISSQQNSWQLNFLLKPKFCQKIKKKQAISNDRNNFIFLFNDKDL